MSIRKRILKEFYVFYEEKGPNNYALADTLRCFTPKNELFLSAITQLLREKLVLGIGTPNEKRVAVALNLGMIDEIEKAIRDWIRILNFG